MTEQNGESTAEEHVPTQSELYEDLQRIGELEDQKSQIQKEIDERTARLAKAIPHLDRSSLLYQMLSAALKPKSTPAAKRTTKTSKKATRKR